MANGSVEQAQTEGRMPRIGPVASWAISAATLALAVAALALQWRAGSFRMGSALLGDEPKHYTSGVMVYDYLRHGLGTNPMRFAEAFEVQYPRLAIGHWPPMYYAVQAGFYFLAGPSIASVEALSALTAAGLALLIFLVVRRGAGVRIALVAASCFVAAPLIQAAAWEAMSDLLTGLFVLLAILAFARLLDDAGNWKAALAFAAFAVAAILTKGSAWALVPFFLLAPWLARRQRFFQSRWFLGAVLLVVAAGSSFYLIAQRTGIGYPARLGHYLTMGLGHRSWMMRQVLGFAPALLVASSVLGAAAAIRARWRGGDQSAWTTLSLVAAAWMASQFVFLALLPMTPEPRVLIPSLAPAAILTARFLESFTGTRRLRPAATALFPVLFGAMVVAEGGAIRLTRVVGYREAANAIPYPAGGALVLMAIEDWRGEGALIAERLNHSREHRDVMLRGTHALNEIEASGVYRPRFPSAEAVRVCLLEMPVQFVVLDKPPYDNAYQYQVESAVLGDPADFRLRAIVPIDEQPRGRVDELRIYENVSASGRHPAVIRTPLGLDGGWRVLEYRWP